MAAVALQWVVYACSHLSNCVKERNRVLYSLGFIASRRSWRSLQRFNNSKKQRGYSCLNVSELENGSKLSVVSSIIANPYQVLTISSSSSSEQKVYDVVLKQAVLVKKQPRSNEYLEVKPEIVLHGTPGLLTKAYDRCGKVCAEYGNTFYLGTVGLGFETWEQPLHERLEGRPADMHLSQTLRLSGSVVHWVRPYVCLFFRNIANKPCEEKGYMGNLRVV